MTSVRPARTRTRPASRPARRRQTRERPRPRDAVNLKAASGLKATHRPRGQRTKAPIHRASREPRPQQTTLKRAHKPRATRPRARTRVQHGLGRGKRGLRARTGDAVDLEAKTAWKRSTARIVKGP